METFIEKFRNSYHLSENDTQTLLSYMEEIRFKKKEVIVHVGLKRIVPRTLARFAEIFVHDNGPGIPEDDMHQIFSLFSRGATGLARTEGLGIGLSVVQRIVELHYGRVGVESRLGEGASFLISLPLERIHFR